MVAARASRPLPKPVTSGGGPVLGHPAAGAPATPQPGHPLRQGAFELGAGPGQVVDLVGIDLEVVELAVTVAVLRVEGSDRTPGPRTRSGTWMSDS